jgi:hypothetical protein
VNPARRQSPPNPRQSAHRRRLITKSGFLVVRKPFGPQIGACYGPPRGSAYSVARARSSISPMRTSCCAAASDGTLVRSLRGQGRPAIAYSSSGQWLGSQYEGRHLANEHGSARGRLLNAASPLAKVDARGSNRGAVRASAWGPRGARDAPRKAGPAGRSEAEDGAVKCRVVMGASIETRQARSKRAAGGEQEWAATVSVPRLDSGADGFPSGPRARGVLLRRLCRLERLATRGLTTACTQ